MRSHALARALLALPDQIAEVSVDLSNGDDSTVGHRAFGRVCELNQDAGAVVVCAESGYLNYDPQA